MSTKVNFYCLPESARKRINAEIEFCRSQSVENNKLFKEYQNLADKASDSLEKNRYKTLANRYKRREIEFAEKYHSTKSQYNFSGPGSFNACA